MEHSHKEIMERYALIRKDKGLSMRKFADVLGVSPSVVSNIEYKKIEKVSGVYINLLCDKLNVSEEWLLTGDGEMYIDLTEEEIIANQFAEIMLNPDNDRQKKLLLVIKNLDKDELDHLINFAKVLKDQRKKPPINE